MKLILFIFLNLILITSIFSTATILEVIPDPKNSRVDTNETERVNLLILENQSIWNSFINYEDIESINNFTYNITHINNFINSFNFSIFNETLQFESLETNLEQNYFNDTQVYSDDEIEKLLLENIISQNTLSTPLVTEQINEAFNLSETKTITIKGEYFSTNNNLNAISDGYIINPVNISPKEYVLEVTSPSFAVPKTSYTLSAHNFWGNGVEIIFETIRYFISMNVDTEMSNTYYSRLTGGDHFKIYEQNGNTYAIFISVSNNYLTIYDITNPASPTLKDSESVLAHSSSAKDIDTAITPNGNIYAVIVTRNNDKIALYDITNPTNIQYKSNYEKESFLDDASSVSLISTDTEKMYAIATNRGNYEYVSLYKIENNNVEYVAKDSKSNPFGGYVYKQNGEIYYIATDYDNDEIETYSISDTSLIRLGQYKDSSVCDRPEEVSTFEKSGNIYAIVRSYEERYYCVLDITDPANIVFETSFGYSEAQSSNRVYAYEKNNQYFVAAPYHNINTNRIYIYEITDLDNVEVKVEKTLSGYSGISDTQFYEVNGEFYLLAFSADNGRFYIYEVSE